MTGYSQPTGYSGPTGYSVPTGHSTATNRARGTSVTHIDYSNYYNPHFYNDTPTYVSDYSGYNYSTYYPETVQYASAGAYAPVMRYDEMTGLTYLSY